jgi:hypothetical protein
VFWTSHDGTFSGNDTLELATIIRTFGPPKETSRLGKLTVLIWDKDITPCLAQVSEAPDSQVPEQPYPFRID